MERQLGNFLEELDRISPNSMKEEEIKKRFSIGLWEEAWDRDLIVRDRERNEKEHESYWKLGSKGFELLNQVRMKKLINHLNISIIKFNKSSDRSSTIMIILTSIIALLTIVLIYRTFLP